jgi:hypothetical protein
MADTSTPQPALFAADGEPVLTGVRTCWGCDGNGESKTREGQCRVCHDGCGWLPDYDPDTAEIPI